MENVDIRLLREIADLETTPQGAYNIRKNGELASRNTTANIDIVSKTDKSGIDIYVKAGTKHQSVHIPVIITQTGLDELVYNDFHIGPDCDIVIVAGCGIHNESHQETTTGCTPSTSGRTPRSSTWKSTTAKGRAPASG